VALLRGGGAVRGDGVVVDRFSFILLLPQLFVSFVWNVVIGFIVFGEMSLVLVNSGVLCWCGILRSDERATAFVQHDAGQSACVRHTKQQRVTDLQQIIGIVSKASALEINRK